MESIRLTQYSHGAGCGCKISPKNLDIILKANTEKLFDPNLLVGFDTKDDAAVYAINETQAVISTTDFFMPIVDDAFDFGRIAATNAISDIYAMGGKPTMAIAILGWPINKLPLELAGQVVSGGRSVCTLAGIPLAGGHSIDSPEPIFGLAVTGLIDRNKIKRNDTAQPGDILFLTKPLGVGVYSTAQKKGILSIDDEKIMIGNMCILNKLGSFFAEIDGIHAMTDVTGFGLAGHLLEMAEGSGLSAELEYSRLPLLPNVQQYIDQGAIPGGTLRNWDSYGHKINLPVETQKIILADPQTSGGLLIAVDPQSQFAVEELAKSCDLKISKIGTMVPRKNHFITIAD